MWQVPQVGSDTDADMTVCRMMMLSYSHAMHGISDDCMGINGAKAIAGELGSSLVEHIFMHAHAHLSPVPHAQPATLVEAARAR